MSFKYAQAYRENGNKKLTKTQLRKLLCKEPRVNTDGSPLYFTEQSHKNQCDINKIIPQYDRTGLLNHVNKMEYQFGDLTGEDYKTMADKVIQAQRAFDDLPSKIRTEFDNSPQKYLEFFNDPSNRDRAIKLGLIRSDWTPETDGLGEHINDESERRIKEPEPVSASNATN